jgi:chromosome partitioning protein
MKTVAILSQKGGTGKTTLALHLAVEAERSGAAAVIVDLDPQASATSWSDLREQETPAVVSAQATRLAQVLATVEAHGAALVFIDTAPHVESAALAAARAADLILIPCRPAILDLKAIGMTIDLVRIAKTPAVVVLNAVPPRGPLTREAGEAVEGYGIPLSPVSLGHRSAFVHALTAGATAQEYEPHGKAAEEVTKLYTWICRHVGM